MIIDRLEELINNDRRTQKELCEYAGISTSTLNNWIKRHSDPAAKFIIPICEFYKVSPEFLLTGCDKKVEVPDFSFEEQHLFALFRRLPSGVKNKFITEMETVLKYIDSDTSDEGVPIRQAK